MSRYQTRSNKRKNDSTIRDDNIQEDSSSSSSSEEEEQKVRSKKNKINTDNKKIESSSDESSSDSDTDERGNIKKLINYDSSSSEDNEDEEKCNCQPPQNPMGIFLNKLFNGKNDHKFNIETRINGSLLKQELKDKLKIKLNKCELDEKQQDWFDTVLNIPHGVYNPLPIDIVKDDVGKYFSNLILTMDKAVYGLQTVKEEIVNYVAQCITTSNPSPRILALHGVAGTGKTKIIREGISKSLNRPMQTFSMGGVKDSQHFVGFDYTYQHSKHGLITQGMLDSKVMNPIFFFDELDKISRGHEGEEIENLLIHMTDPVQNHDFKDKYIGEIPIDLSKVIFIFAFNNIENINPILLDRLHIVNIPTPSVEDKLIIAKNYLIDELLKNIGLNNSDFIITDEALKYIIQKYSSDGVRPLKRCIETVLLKINTIKLLGKNIKDVKISFKLKDYNLPIKVDEEVVKIFLKSHETGKEELKNPYMYM
jgi:ATP-dependent Lon protease